MRKPPRDTDEENALLADLDASSLLETEEELIQRNLDSHTSRDSDEMDAIPETADQRRIRETAEQNEVPEEDAKKKSSKEAKQARQTQKDEVVPPPRVRPLSLVVLLALLAGAGWEAFTTMQQHEAAPGETDWQAAVLLVRKERDPKEPLVFAPAWVEPLGRKYFRGDLSLEQMTLPDLDRFSRVWQVSIRGARHPWLAGLTPDKTWPGGGTVTVSRFIKPAAEILYDFTQHIMEASVQRRGPQTATCQKRGKRFICDEKRTWNWAGPHLAEVKHRPYRCVFVHPVDHHTMRVTYPAVPMGSKLVGYTGIDDFENVKRAKEPVNLNIYVGDTSVGAVVHQNDQGWRRFSFDTKAHAGQTHPVRFEVNAKIAFSRTFCFSAEVRR